MSKECTTHHHACDCREEKFKLLELENGALRVRLEVLALNSKKQTEELERENAALREDKERLDYMEKNVDFVSWMYCGKPHSWDFRGKIDARRKEAQP